MSKNRKKKQKAKARAASKKKATRRDFIPLSAHQRKGGVLHTPWTSYLNTTPSSWARERLPEMLWAVLAISGPSRDLGLALFRRIARLSQDVKVIGPKADVTLSALGDWPDARASFFQAISEWPAKEDCFSPLLLFPDLPLADQWKTAIGVDPDPEDWEYLKYAVAKSFWHQSEQATDCRWVRLMFQLGCGRMHFPREMAGELDDLNNYPRQGDLRRIRPFIRVQEMMINQMVDRAPNPWPEQFWRDAHRRTSCGRVESSVPPIPTAGTTAHRVEEVRAVLSSHAIESEPSTGIDAKHNAVFGMALFALALLDELMSVGNGSAILGRLGLRSIVDVYITLSFLVSKDTEELWVSWRHYGAERAKLAFLKLAGDETAQYIEADALGDLANWA